jgi:hypothetical protein
LKTDHWFYSLFQSAPDLITLLLPPEPNCTRHQMWCPASGWPEAMGQSPAGSHARILALPQ